MVRILLLLFPLFLFAHPYSYSFSQRLFNEVYKPQQNLILSPYSIHNSLLLLYAGSTTLCQYELKRALELDQLEDLSELQAKLTDQKVVSANALWTHSELKISDTFSRKDEVESLNLHNPKSAALRIEEWASSKSKKKFAHFLKDVDLKSTSHAYLTDIASMKSSWKYPFRTKDRIDEAFYGEEKGTASYMCQTAEHLFYEDETCKLIALPLENDLQCIFYMPLKAPFTLPSQTLLKRMQPQKVYVQIPHLTIQQNTQLNRPLMSLGITKPFFRGAEFGNICPTNSFHICEILHQSGVSINEWGIDASASLFALSRDYKPPSSDATHHFIANHPFLYLIVDSKEDILLFLGTYCHPQG